MNGTSASAALAGFGVLSLILSVTIASTATTADLNISSWTFTEEPQLSTPISGVTTVSECPAEITNCQAEYSGQIKVNLSIVDDAFQITPEVTVSEVSIVEIPVEESSEVIIESEV